MDQLIHCLCEAFHLSAQTGYAIQRDLSWACCCSNSLDASLPPADMSALPHCFSFFSTTVAWLKRYQTGETIVEHTRLRSRDHAGAEPTHKNDVTFESNFTLKCGKGLKLRAYIAHGKLQIFLASLIYHKKVLNEYFTMTQKS